MCPNCGQPVTPDQRFCAACGAKLDDPAVAPVAPVAPVAAAAPVGSEPPTEPDPGDAADVDYPSESKVLAGILTVFFPFISLIVALVMRSSERRPLRRASLLT